MPLVNAKEMIQRAFEDQYAIAQINTNNLEWTKAILLTAQENNSPVIIGTSEGAIKYMGGFKAIFHLVNEMIKNYNITVPIALHLDHGSYEGAFKALEAGYTSVMFDGSHYSFEKNIFKTKKVIAQASKQNASVEVEVGTIGGEEDGTIGDGILADPNEVKEIALLGPNMIAAGINNIHGTYPKNWTGLNFDILSQLKAIAKMPLVLHGGTGIPEEQVKKAILMGISKINVNTELQIANAKAIREFVRSGESDKNKNFDPRKFLAPGFEAIKKIIKQKFEIFGSINKA